MVLKNSRRYILSVKVEPHEPVCADVHPFSLLEESSLTGEKFWLVGDI
jgi:hypothetical protein